MFFVLHTWLRNEDDWRSVLSDKGRWTSGRKNRGSVFNVTPKATGVGERAAGVCSVLQDWESGGPDVGRMSV